MSLWTDIALTMQKLMTESFPKQPDAVPGAVLAAPVPEVSSLLPVQSVSASATSRQPVVLTGAVGTISKTQAA